MTVTFFLTAGAGGAVWPGADGAVADAGDAVGAGSPTGAFTLIGCTTATDAD